MPTTTAAHHQHLLSMSDSGMTRGDGDSSVASSSVNTIGRHEFEFGVRTMPPPLSELLESSGCRLFLDAMRSAGRLEGVNSVTILAPNDNAFYSGVCLLCQGQQGSGRRLQKGVLVRVLFFEAHIPGGIFFRCTSYIFFPIFFTIVDSRTRVLV